MNAWLMTRWPMLWRRELWERRSLWIAPVVAAAVLLLLMTAGALQLTRVNLGPLQLGGKVEVSTPDAQVSVAPDGIVVSAKDEDDQDVVINLPGVMARSTDGTPAGQHAVPLQVVLWIVNGLLLVAACFPLTGYLLDSLHADRRDRSVLFWRSLPVSDTQTVLAKYSMVAVVLLGTWLLALPVSVAVVGLVKLSNAGALLQLDWTVGQWLHTQASLLGYLVVALLWYAPLAAWMMAVSAWAGRAPFAWMIAPPVILMALESALLGSRRVAQLVGLRLTPPDPTAALLSWQLWAGLVVAAGLIVLAIRLRRTAEAI